MNPETGHKMAGLSDSCRSDIDEGGISTFWKQEVDKPQKDDGGLDWAGVTEIEIIEIADTH